MVSPHGQGKMPSQAQAFQSGQQATGQQTTASPPATHQPHVYYSSYPGGIQPENHYAQWSYAPYGVPGPPSTYPVSGNPPTFTRNALQGQDPQDHLAAYVQQQALQSTEASPTAADNAKPPQAVAQPGLPSQRLTHGVQSPAAHDLPRCMQAPLLQPEMLRTRDLLPKYLGDWPEVLLRYFARELDGESLLHAAHGCTDDGITKALNARPNGYKVQKAQIQKAIACSAILGFENWRETERSREETLAAFRAKRRDKLAGVGVDYPPQDVNDEWVAANKTAYHLKRAWFHHSLVALWEWSEVSSEVFPDKTRVAGVIEQLVQECKVPQERQDDVLQGSVDFGMISTFVDWFEQEHQDGTDVGVPSAFLDLVEAEFVVTHWRQEQLAKLRKMFESAALQPGGVLGDDAVDGDGNGGNAPAEIGEKMAI